MQGMTGNGDVTARRLRMAAVAVSSNGGKLESRTHQLDRAAIVRTHIALNAPCSACSAFV